MSGRARIAPELEHIVAKIGAYWCGTTMPKVKEAQAQLRALLAVAKAAARFHAYVNDYSDPIDDYDQPLRAALARLERASGRAKK